MNAEGESEHCVHRGGADFLLSIEACQFGNLKPSSTMLVPKAIPGILLGQV